MNLWIRRQDRRQLSCCTLMQINEHYEDTICNKANKEYESYMSILKSGGMSRDYNAVKRNAEKEKQRVYENAKTVFSIVSNDGILGSYHSEKRALEILDEIQTILSPQSSVMINNVDLRDIETQIECTNFNTTRIENAEIKQLQQPSIVYEMPEA